MSSADTEVMRAHVDALRMRAVARTTASAAARTLSWSPRRAAEALLALASEGGVVRVRIVAECPDVDCMLPVDVDMYLDPQTLQVRDAEVRCPYCMLDFSTGDAALYSEFEVLRARLRGGGPPSPRSLAVDPPPLPDRCLVPLGSHLQHKDSDSLGELRDAVAALRSTGVININIGVLNSADQIQNAGDQSTLALAGGEIEGTRLATANSDPQARRPDAQPVKVAAGDGGRIARVDVGGRVNAEIRAVGRGSSVEDIRVGSDHGWPEGCADD